MIGPIRRNPLLALVWLLCLVPVFYLTAWPLLENWWAGWGWRKTDCNVNVLGNGVEQYAYTLDGKQVITTHRDVWDAESVQPVINIRPKPYPGTPGVCYVTPWNNESSVLHLDGHQNLGRGARCFGIAAVLLALATFVTIHQIRKRKAAAPVSEPAADERVDESGPTPTP